MTPQEMFPELSPEAADQAMRLNAQRGLIAQPPVPGLAPTPVLGGSPAQAGAQAPPVPALSPSSFTANPIGQPGPVPTPGQPRVLPEVANAPLDALREQMGVVNQLVGAHPQAPYINHMLVSGSPTAGLMSLNGGRHGGGMVGSQDQGGVTVDPAAALQTSIFNTQDAGHGHDQQMLLSRLGTMADQALRGGALNLDTIRTLGAPGIQGQMARDNQLAQSSVDANGLNRLNQQQLGARYNAHMENPVNGRTPAQRQASWDALNMPMPGFTQGPAADTPAGNTPPTPAPDGGPLAAGGGNRRRPNLPSDTPASLLSAAHGEVETRYAPPGATPGSFGPIPDNRANDAITDMIHALGPQFARDNQGALGQYIVQKFGQGAFDNWVQNGMNGRAGLLSPANRHNAALNSLLPGLPTLAGGNGR